MTLEKSYYPEAETELSQKIATINDYLNTSGSKYRHRFAKGYIHRNKDESLNQEDLNEFADKKAIQFIGENVLELYGASEKSAIYLPAGDEVLNAMHNKIRYHLGRIIAVQIGKDPDDFRVAPLDFDDPYRYVPYSRGSGNGEKLLAESVFLPGRYYNTGINCQYDFSRSFPDETVPTLGICAISYIRNPDSDA